VASQASGRARLGVVRSGGRLTNVALLGLLASAFFSGWVAFELTGQPARAVLVLHAAAGVAIVLLVPWKSLIARRGLRRPRSMRWASIVLALGVVISLVFGFLHSFGRPDLAYLTAMDFHVGAALCVLPFVVWHVVARPAKLRPPDLSRRNFLKGAALLGASALGVVALPGARRAPTGSYQAAYAIPTQWMFDATPDFGVESYRLSVAGRRWTYGELAAFDDRVTTVLDCTGGWYSEQEWAGVWLDRLLPANDAGLLSVNVRSITGYSRRFDIGDVPHVLLATRLEGSALDPGNGFPVRLVVPGRRGFTWVKWVTSVDAEMLPSWWQPPFPLQ
jgi:molybdopterin-dependent oxidoreductase-like protein protein/TAT (twin-arginine translocation) pathway-exported protein